MRISRNVKKGIVTLTAATVLGLASVAIIETLVYVSEKMVRPPLEGMENQVIDLAFQVRKQSGQNKKITPEDIVIIDIDDASIAQLGRSQNWPRSYDARVINYIASGNPAAIGIDFLYTESDGLPTPYSDLLIEKGIENSEEIAQVFSTDDELSKAIRDAGCVYLSFFDDDAITDSITDEHVLNSLRTIDSDASDKLKLYTIHHPVLPIDSFLLAARGTGSISVPTMYDGTVRHYRLLQELKTTGQQKKYTANFPFYMMLDQYGLKESDVKFVDQGIQVGDSIKIPLQKNGTFRINWLGNEEKIRYISYYKVWDELVPAEFFENKFVFLGTSASGLQDLKTVPSREDKMPGVEVHAIAFLNMMNGSFLNEITERQALPWFCLISILHVLLFLFTRPLAGFLLAFALYFGERFLFELWVIPEHNLIFPITTLMLLTLLTYLLSSLYVYFIRERRNRVLKNAFGTYVSPEIVEQIAKDPDKLQLGGEKKELTVMFSDLRNFTTYSEKLDPQQIVAVLNNYLSVMSNIIFVHKGTIDKFIGDAIMAIFGAPIAQKDHADRACRVALDMFRELKNVNEDNAQQGYPPLSMGVGINTGDMTVGNIGSEKRFDYTVIGDAVNLGSRLEGLTKYFNVEIIVSETTKKACITNQFIFRELGSVLVKGKNDSIKAFELLDPNYQQDDFKEWYASWQSAINNMQQRKLAEALIAIELCESLRPRDFATVYFKHRCETCLQQPEEFDMVIKMDSK
jgi:adenylate cyclase